MTEPEPRIAQLIDVYTPRSSGRPDWDDVVRRAARPAARQPLVTGTRVLLIAAALAVLLTGSAAAGVGPGRLLLGLVRDEEPAPAPVKHALAHVFRWPHGTHVLLSQSRLVSRQAEITALNPQQTRPITQTVENWIAPIRDGGYCFGEYFVPGDGPRAGYSYSCIRGPLQPAVRLHQTSPVAWRTPAGRLFWEPWVVDGTVPAATTRAVLVRRDGSRTDVSLARSATGGVRYFAIRLTAATAPAAPDEPARIVAFDAAGRRIAATSISRHDQRPLIVRPEAGGGGGPRRSVRFGSTRGVFQGEPGTAVLSVKIDAAGGPPCLVANFRPDRAEAEPSGLSDCAGGGSGLTPQIETNLGVHIGYGQTPARVQSVQMILVDGTRLPVATHDGAYLVVIPNRLFRSGNLPARLVGRDAGGHVVAHYTFSRSRDFPDY